MTPGQRLAAVLGGVALVLGLVLAVVPADAGGADCGSVLSPKDQVAESSSFGDVLARRSAEADCDDELGTRRMWALVLGLGGLAGLVAGIVNPGGWLTGRGESPPRATTQEVGGNEP